MSTQVSTFAIMAVMLHHWIGDFVLQTHAMAQGKSSSNRILASHVATWTAVMLAFGLAYLPLGSALAWAALNGVLHFATDWVTSRKTSRLWKEARWHDFFVMLGLDQLIHALTLVATLMLFAPPDVAANPRNEGMVLLTPGGVVRLP